MADLPPELAALFRMRPERAADYLAAKGLKLTGPYWELDGPAHSRVFTVANLAKLDVLADIKAALQEAIDTGQTERWTRDRLVPILQKKGWWGPAVQVDPDTLEARIIQQGSLRRLQTIYRTNIQSAYMAGRHRQALAEADRAPYAQYIAVRDARTRPGHAALHGKVFRLDSTEWSVVSPPNGYNCRCRARYLSERELAARGLKVETDVRLLERPMERIPVDRATGDSPDRIIQRGVSVPDRISPNERAVLYADLGWDHLPGSTGGERRLIDRMMVRADALGDGVKQVVLADLARRGADFARAAVAAGVAKQSVYIAAPDVAELAAVARSARVAPDLTGYALGLDHDRVRHILSGHGTGDTETPRGQRAVAPEDFARVADLLRAATDLRPGDPPMTTGGTPLYQVDARQDGERWRIVFEVRRKQRLVVPYTVWVWGQ